MGFMVKKLLNLHFYFIFLFLDSVDLISNNNQPIKFIKDFCFYFTNFTYDVKIKKEKQLIYR